MYENAVPQIELAELSGDQISICKLRLLENNAFPAEVQLFAQRHKLTRQEEAGNCKSLCFISFEEDQSLEAEAYQIHLEAQSIVVKAADGAGAFYASATLSQWLWAYHSLPCGWVKDSPRYPWRGFMLDVTRHFMPLSYVKKLIEQLSIYKFNRLHLHLTDDQGWRLPSKNYPKLNTISSMRYTSFDSFYNDEHRRGGFYSAADLREIQEHAKKFHITIVPEIDLPGHVNAVLAAYPELNCRAEDIKVMELWGISRSVLCLGNPESWDFLRNCLDEVLELFPDSPYIHLGGDECPRDHWKDCPKCQAFIAEHGLDGEDGLQNHFTKISRDYLRSKGRTPLYWDEAEESGLSENTVICYWRAWLPGIDEQAAEKGVPVISCPTSHCYFDYPYQADLEEKGFPLNADDLENSSILSVEDSFKWQTLAERRPELASYNIGVQANLWTEYVLTARDCEYMIYPRLLATAEQAWRKSTWEVFQQKWPTQKRVLKNGLGVHNYYRGPWSR